MHARRQLSLFDWNSFENHFGRNFQPIFDSYKCVTIEYIMDTSHKHIILQYSSIIIIK